MVNYMDVFWFSVSNYCQLSNSTSTSSTFNDFISGAPSSGWAKVILEDQNNTHLGFTGIFYFPDVKEVKGMIQNSEQFENFSEEVAYCYGKIYWLFPYVLFGTYSFVNFHI